MDQAQPTKRQPAMLWPLLAVFAGLFLLTAFGLPAWQHAQADYSVPVRALVVESSTRPAVGPIDRVWPQHEFAYHYLHQGQLYVGRGYRHRGGVGPAVSRYAAGSLITVWIDPDRPERALVETRIPLFDLALLVIGLIILALGLLLLLRLVSRDRSVFEPGSH